MFSALLGLKTLCLMLLLCASRRSSSLVSGPSSSHSGLEAIGRDCAGIGADRAVVVGGRTCVPAGAMLIRITLVPGGPLCMAEVRYDGPLDDLAFCAGKGEDAMTCTTGFAGGGDEKSALLGLSARFMI